ncbi:hypothetical protein DRO58_01200 [Candidatus Bathyarchaeota archaeon]|nr:MAG: hypothetical protein DRO58_01200 [Candidatus Bathyarchaeota archaeon]
MSSLPERARLEKLRELLRARIPAKWWWCDFNIIVNAYDRKGKRGERELFEAIDETIEMALKVDEERGSKRIQLRNWMYSNIREIGEKVEQLQYMEKVMRRIEEAKRTADENQLKELASLQLQLVDEFRRNNCIITATENEIIQEIDRMTPPTAEKTTKKVEIAFPREEEAEETVRLPDAEINSLLDRVRKINYEGIPFLRGIQEQIDRTVERARNMGFRELSEEERREIISQLRFWADGETYFPQLANITLEALEPGYASFNGIPIEYVRMYVEYQDQIPLRIDLTNQMLIVTEKERQAASQS